MHPKQIVVIGASAGGIEALRTVVAGLPADFAAPICIVLHTAPQGPGLLHEILTRAGAITAVSPSSEMRLEPGRIYVAPPDYHLVVEPGRLRVSKGPRENRFRPAIDPLFRSAAQVYGPGAIGVVLTGNLDDGTAGLRTIKQLGGIAIVQDPAEALYSGMPKSALQHVDVDHVVSLAQVAPLLVAMTSVPVAETGFAVPDQVRVEVNIAMEHNPVDSGLERLGEPSRFACPECHGVLLQIKDGSYSRFRCHTGHAYSIASLLAAVGEGIEEALWNSIRALEEGQLLMNAVAVQLETGNDEAAAGEWLTRAKEAKRHSDVIRRLALARDPLPATTK